LKFCCNESYKKKKKSEKVTSYGTPWEGKQRRLLVQTLWKQLTVHEKVESNDPVFAENPACSLPDGSRLHAC
jgi:hypothetical protein